MSDGLLALRSFLVSRYDDLKGRLTRRLGSADMAGDALQDTWLRLNNKETGVGEVSSPQSYLLRMAFNIAVDQQRANKHLLNASQIDELLDLEDAGATPESIALTRSDCDILTQAMEAMPARRRAILLAVRLDGTPQNEIAERLGISVRVVQRELKRAHEHCAEIFNEK